MIRALITVYNPTPDVCENIHCIAAQSDIVYICDNSAHSNRALFAGLRENIFYLFFGRNLGISQAFNFALTNPKIPWKNEDYVIFFDQDSRIAENHIAKLVSVHKALLQSGRPVGCLGPVFYNTSSGQVERSTPLEILQENVSSVSDAITSSMLCRYDALKSAGFWNEDIFLDLADWDLCWRMRQAGLLCCAAEDVVLHHSLGVGEKKIGPFSLRVGQPFREYYQIREALYLLEKDYTPSKYKLRFLANLFVRTPLHLAFLNKKKDRLQYVLKGVLDHTRNKRGRINL